MGLSWLEEISFLFLWNNYLQSPFCLILHQHLRVTNEFQNASLWKVRKESIIQNVNWSPHCVISCCFFFSLIVRAPVTVLTERHVREKSVFSSSKRSKLQIFLFSGRDAKLGKSFRNTWHRHLRHIPNMYYRSFIDFLIDRWVRSMKKLLCAALVGALMTTYSAVAADFSKILTAWYTTMQLQKMLPVK